VTCWLDLAHDDPFGIEHLPFGAADTADGRRIAVIRIGPWALDLTTATEQLSSAHAPLFAGGSLDAFLAAGRPSWLEVRELLTRWLSDEAYRPLLEPLLAAVDDVALRLPFTVADYVDFYASEAHATNVGRIFRPDGAALTPNWKHLPIGYHGRAGTVVVSGTDVRRPVGQALAPDGSVNFGPSQRLDSACRGEVLEVKSPALRARILSAIAETEDAAVPSTGPTPLRPVPEPVVPGDHWRAPRAYAIAAVLLVSSFMLSFAGWAAKQPMKKYGVRV